MQHPDEGTIHAWLDGELPEGQANEIAAHASDCPECSALVAEARGLIAASTRILTALDNVPAGVIPEEAAQLPAPARRRRWYNRTDIRAAAALLIVAGASFLVVQRDSGASREVLRVADEIQPAPAPVAERAAIKPSVAVQQAAGRAVPPITRMDKAMPKATITGRKTQAPLTSRADAVVTAPSVAEPTTATSPPAVSSIAGAVKVTSKRGKAVDSAYFLGERSVTGAALSAAEVTGVATMGNVASPSLRVLSVDSATTTRRTVYEISQGVGVTLAESPVNAGKEERDFSAQLKSSAPASAKVAQSMIAAAAPAPVINTISWTEHGRRYTLSGPLTIDELQALKTRLMLMRR
jgi:anti-sigma factor RsiW